MAEITAEMVRVLREASGAGMMDCKKALIENDGNQEAAMDWLRKKGMSAAAKKSGRVTAEGLVGIATSGTKGAVIELNSETDFVARNDQFQALANAIAKLALDNGKDVDTLKAADFPGTGRNVADEVANAIGVIGENINLRRSATLSVGSGVVASYIHTSVAPGLGKIGVLVALESTGDAEKLATLGKQIAMHVAAAKPESLNTDGVDPEALEREREVLREQSRASGKPADIIEKMVEGRVRKFYEEIVLLEQVYVIDGKSRVGEVVEAAAKELGTPVKLTGFVRFALGEGVEKQESNFAEEVAAATRAA